MNPALDCASHRSSHVLAKHIGNNFTLAGLIQVASHSAIGFLFCIECDTHKIAHWFTSNLWYIQCIGDVDITDFLSANCKRLTLNSCTIQNLCTMLKLWIGARPVYSYPSLTPWQSYNSTVASKAFIKHVVRYIIKTHRGQLRCQN